MGIKLFYHEKTDFRQNFTPLAIETSDASLRSLTVIPEEQQLLIGKPLAKGHGTGSDIELGRQVARKELNVIDDKVQSIIPIDTDFVLLIGSLAGGTGGGCIPIIAERLRKSVDPPVYVLGILPAEEEGNIYILNAVDSLKQTISSSDGVILVHNGTALRKIAYDISLSLDEINRRIAVFLRMLASACVGEYISPQDVVATLSPFTGVSTFGIASTKIMQGGTQAQRITYLANRVMKSRGGSGLVLPCNYRSATRTLILITGPPNEIQEGYAIARKWLTTNARGIEVRGGEYPISGMDQIEILALVSGLTDVEAIKRLYRQAKSIKASIMEKREELESKRESFDKVFEESDIDSLF